MRKGVRVKVSVGVILNPGIARDVYLCEVNEEINCKESSSLR